MASLSGADDFLLKPCREDELFESIRSLLQVVFDYEEAQDVDKPEEALAWSAEGLVKLPRELLEKLRDATKGGNRKLLKQLIVQVRDAAGDTGSAVALQGLADKYEYDVLSRLLEEACRA